MNIPILVIRLVILLVIRPVIRPKTKISADPIRARAEAGPRKGDEFVTEERYIIDD